MDSTASCLYLLSCALQVDMSSTRKVASGFSNSFCKVNIRWVNRTLVRNRPSAAAGRRHSPANVLDLASVCRLRGRRHSPMCS